VKAVDDLRREREELTRRDYVQQVNLALHEVQEDNAARAEEKLDLCPKGLRGWEWHHVMRQIHLDRLTYIEHTLAVLALAVSPDGAWVASAASPPWTDGTSRSNVEIHVWDARTGRRRLTLEGPGVVGTVQGIAFSPDGSRIAAGGGTYGVIEGGS